MPGPGNVGERVRNLRLTRRLSQAQLADDDLSDSYISLIESGKRMPTPAVLRLLAERLGCTPEYLADGIEPQQRTQLVVQERHAELTLHGGDPAAALSVFEEVIARSDDVALTHRAHWGRARALERLGSIEAAIGALEELREQAEQEPGQMSWLPAVIALARCYHMVGDIGQAIALGERTLHRLHDLELTDGIEHIEAARVLLLAYVDRSDSARAHWLGRQVFTAAQLDGAALVTAYQRASELALRTESVGDALFLADRAVAVQAEEPRPRDRARLQLAGARALLRGVPAFQDGTDAPGEALSLLRAAAPALEDAEAAECTLETARALILLGDPDQAVSGLEAAFGHDIAVPAAPSGRAVEAVRASLLLAQARLAQQDPSEALAVLRSAAAQLEKLPPDRSTAHAFRELGELFESAGDCDGAATAYRHALEAAGLRPSVPAAHPTPSPDLAGR